MKQNVHYDPTTGEIRSWGSALPVEGETSHFPEHDLIVVEFDGMIDPVRHKIIDGAVVEKSTNEVEQMQSTILLRDLQQRIAAALAASDWIMSPPPDRPMRDVNVEAWRIYRATLRGLSKLPTPAAMLAAWPVSPSGESK